MFHLYDTDSIGIEYSAIAQAVRFVLCLRPYIAEHANLVKEMCRCLLFRKPWLHATRECHANPLTELLA